MVGLFRLGHPRRAKPGISRIFEGCRGVAGRKGFTIAHEAAIRNPLPIQPLD